MDAAADLLQAAESDLDSRVYGDDCGGDIVCNNIAYERPRRQRRQKRREVRTH
ncbi:MAG: hypothetical protein ACJ8DX_00375 [Xanthobacteraceae bacterium]